MGALNFSISREGREAVLTRDQLRADIQFEFELRVAPTKDGISTAAQALGSRIARGGDTVKDVFAGALVGAIQRAAAARTLEEIHLDRAGFSSDVAEVIESQASKLGLTLVSASLIAVDQSDLGQWSENNAFNAQGMRRLAELVANQRKERVRIETEAAVAVRASQLAQHQRQLDLKREEREAEIAQKEHLAKLEANAKSREDRARDDARLESETARIENEKRAKSAQVECDEALRKAEMAAIRTLEEEKINNDIKLAMKRGEEAEAKAAEEEARVKVVLAVERVQGQKGTRHRRARARNRKAEPGKRARTRRGQSQTRRRNAARKSRGQMRPSKTKEGEAERARMEAEAAGRAALNNSENALSDAVIRMRLEERKLDRLPEIMTQMMKPVEKIDSIKINQISGVGGEGGGSGEGADGAFGAAMDQISGHGRASAGDEADGSRNRARFRCRRRRSRGRLRKPHQRQAESPRSERMRPSQNLIVNDTKEILTCH